MIDPVKCLQSYARDWKLPDADTNVMLAGPGIQFEMSCEHDGQRHSAQFLLTWEYLARSYDVAALIKTASNKLARQLHEAIEAA